jgi:uncharacterized protein (DUF305 family)
MALFSRAFIRKRVISLATTTSLAATSFALAQDPTTTHHLRGASPIQNAADQPDRSNEQPFLSENETAMNKMMAGMKIKPTGDVDRDFVEMMVPHHQGAVDMAQAELKYGHDKRLRRLAREIVTTQQQEITFMRLVLSQATSAATQTDRGAVPASQEGRSSSSVISTDPMSHHSMDMK